MTDVFISYSRKDKEFALRLHEALTRGEYKVWIDWKDIHPTTDWWEEIEAGIEAANVFIFIMSSDSLNSKYCNKEIDHAVRHNKKLIPVAIQANSQLENIRPE